MVQITSSKISILNLHFKLHRVSFFSFDFEVNFFKKNCLHHVFVFKLEPIESQYIHLYTHTHTFLLDPVSEDCVWK